MNNAPTLPDNITAEGSITVKGTLTVNTLQMDNSKNGIHLAAGGTDTGQAPLYFDPNGDFLVNPVIGAIEMDNYGLLASYRDNWTQDITRFTVLGGVFAAHPPVAYTWGSSAIGYVYGSAGSSSNVVLSEPDFWIRVNINGESCIIPAYYESA